MLNGAALSKKEIRSLCGSVSYNRGEGYFRSRLVTELTYDPDEDTYHAKVKGGKPYNVSVSILEDEVVADCSCPAFGTRYDFCKHVAAVLLQIEELSKQGVSVQPAQPPQAQPKPLLAQSIFKPAAPPVPTIPAAEAQLANSVLALFERLEDKPSSMQLADREPAEISVEYTCRFTTGYRCGIYIGLRLGADRLYVVQNIKDLFNKMERRSKMFFTKRFTFHPGYDRFTETDSEIMRLLGEIYRNEQLYREMGGGLYYLKHNDRTLFIPPSAWEKLRPLLQEAKVLYEVDTHSFERLELREGMVPLDLSLSQGPVHRSYKLSIQGLSGFYTMDTYGFGVTADGQMYRVEPEQAAGLSQLRSLLDRTKGEITIPPAQVDSFLLQVMPKLKRMGRFTVDDAIREQVVNDPLQARVYLDWVDDKLCAKISFEYGDIRYSPFGGEGKGGPSDGRIVMREADKERAVLDMVAAAKFRHLRDEFVLDDEEAVYEFLFSGLGRLQQLAEVFVTPAVQAIRSQRAFRPRANIDVDGSNDWLEVRFDLGGVDERELVRLLRSITEKKKYHRLSGGEFVSLEDEGFQEIGRLLAELGVRKSELKGGNVRLSVVRGLSLQEYDGTGAAHVKLGKSLRHLLDCLKHPDHLEHEPPVTLAPILRDYQKIGYQWMKMLGTYGFGGILADDMGLGKTLQSIAYILSEREKREFAGEPVLIVCPASLIYNWRNELAKFAPQLRVSVVAGSKAERDGILEGAAAAETDVLITSYPLLRRDVEWYSQQRFHAVFLDEAQAIKNSETQTAQSVKSLSAAHRFALTGTPVENRLEELWSIYDAVFPELFGGRKAFLSLKPEQVARKIRPFLLRRLKSDVLSELPEKIETLQTSDLSEEQKKLYMAYLMRLKEETSASLQAEGFQRSRMKILAGLTRLRQLCCHPSLFLEDYQGESGKLAQLLELLEECMESGKRMLIFSQFTGMLSLIREQLEQRGWSYFYLDGATKPAERVELCRRFNDGDASMFLISLKAGGTGLNLTGADTVILYDLWWNPAVEQQAADRAHRIGQKKVVQVIRLIAEGTIEEKMYELQQRKKDLIDAVIRPGEESLSTLTEEDVRELLSI